MNEVLLLRFRDLVTKPGGTIVEHRSILTSHKRVWWGWWKRGGEIPPRSLFAEMKTLIDEGSIPKAYLFDATHRLLFRSEIADIKVSPTISGITSPEPAKSPEYYHRGCYAVWFLLTSIDDVNLEELDLSYHSVPTDSEENKKYEGSKGHRIESVDFQSEGLEIRSLRDLRKIDVTMWVLSDKGT